MMQTTRAAISSSLRAWFAVAVCAALLVVAVVASAASAAPEIASFSAGLSNLQAGAHADANVNFTLATETTSIPNPLSGGFQQIVRGGPPKDVVIDLPRGLVGDPQSASTCANDELSDPTVGCPLSTQVGFAVFTVIAFGSPSRISSGVYNMAPLPGEVARFGMRLGGEVNAFVSVKVRTNGDYGLTTTVANAYDGLPLIGTDLTIWGVPADPSHDNQRCPDPDLTLSPAICNGLGAGGSGPADVNPLPANAPREPFMTNPSECGVSGSATLRVDSWTDPGDYATQTSDPQQLTGCEKEAFNPSINVSSDTTQRGAPMGMNVDIDIPQTYDNPDGLATPPMQNAVVTLPLGVGISPSAADGLAGCSDQQMGFGTNDPVACPSASRIGNVSVRTPLLPDTLTGGIYLGTQESNDPESGQMFRIALELRDDARGLLIKLPGQIRVDPRSGQITAVFNDNPRLPFSNLDLQFKSGPRAPLTMPSTCGTATTTADLSGWGMPAPAHVSTSFDVTTGCDQGFSPTFKAGTVSAAAEHNSTFTLTFGRSDSDQTLKDIAVTMPPGLLANISSAVLCPDAAAALGTCADVSKIGTTTTAAGPGSNPFYLPGTVYITGPYRGAPFGLSIVVPAIAGPFNLGNVIVRAAIFVDKHTAALRIVSDPLPTILEGVPLDIRSVNITIDRAGFMFNPSSCNPMSIGATLDSNAGAAANVSSRFQVGSCSALPFKPKMTISAGGKGHDGARASTPLKVVLAMPKANANNKTVDVTLPSSLNAHLQALQHPCSQADFDNDKCGPLAKVGTASAVTPVLRDPLRGGVYFVTNPRRGALPYMEVQLRGQVAVDLRATIKTTPLVETRFEGIPDVPITKFTLNLVSGKQGPVGVRTNLCREASVAKAGLRAQNGKLVQAKPKITLAGCAKKPSGEEGRVGSEGKAR